MTREILFFKNHAANDAGRLVQDPFLLFKKASFEVKASGRQLSFNIFRKPSTWYTVKPNCIKLKNIVPEICSILIF